MFISKVWYAQDTATGRLVKPVAAAGLGGKRLCPLGPAAVLGCGLAHSPLRHELFRCPAWGTSESVVISDQDCAENKQQRSCCREVLGFGAGMC